MSGTGTVTLRVTGLLDAQRWTVDIDAGTIARPNEGVEIASKAGADVTRLTMDTVRIHLTKTEMAAFAKAQKAGGVVAIVSDGLRVGYAEFAGSYADGKPTRPGPAGRREPTGRLCGGLIAGAHRRGRRPDLVSPGTR